MRILRVFPRRTKATPDDELAFVGDPPLFRPAADDVDEVHVSCTFTWDAGEAKRLACAWLAYYPGKTFFGGPAFGASRTAAFVPGRYLKRGYVITSRGCPNRCKHCQVPKREGRLTTLPITDGWNVQDNNLLACPRGHVEAVFEMLGRQKRRALLSGGLEASRVEPWVAAAVAALRVEGAYLACDMPTRRTWRTLEAAVGLLRDAGGWPDGTARKRLRCYVLVAYDGDDVDAAQKRCLRVYRLGVQPYPMFYQPGPGQRRQTAEWHDLLGRWMKARAPLAAEAKT